VTAITADGSTAWVHQGLDIAELYPARDFNAAD
jgi:hypothetical protein